MSHAHEEYGLDADVGDLLPGDAWYFLAMAHHDLGHYREARKWFDKAESYTLTTLQQPAAIRSRLFDRPGSIHWHQRVALEHLQREARTVLNVPGAKPKLDEN